MNSNRVRIDFAPSRYAVLYIAHEQVVDVFVTMKSIFLLEYFYLKWNFRPQWACLYNSPFSPNPLFPKPCFICCYLSVLGLETNTLIYSIWKYSFMSLLFHHLY